jgi:hypothetical protein
VAARVAVAGDFLPSGNLAFPAGCGWREMARRLEPHFRDVATTFLNLECAVDTDGLQRRPLSGIGQIVSAPPDSLDYAHALHCHAIGMANNHSLDFGLAGVERTRHAISHCGLQPLGAGHTTQDPPEILIWRGPGELRVGFWAAAKATLDPATHAHAGVEPASLDRAHQAIQLMKSQGARFCIALLHAGCMRTSHPDPEDVRHLDSIARCGFDIVAASHSHRINGFKVVDCGTRQPSFCFYGLGSLVSGYISSPLEREGLVIVVGLNRGGELVELEARPVLLDETGFGTVPDPALTEVILRWLMRLSNEVADGSFARSFYSDVSGGLLQFYLRDAKTALRESGLRGLARKASRVRVRHVRRLVHKVVG